MDQTGPVAVALLGSDLLLASRLRAALGPLGISLTQVTADPLPPAARVLFVDLNQEPDRQIEAISRLLARSPGTLVVGFCDHEEKEVRRRAMAAGARQVVANRHLAQAAGRLLAGVAGADPS
jgi:hypothetical protein